jgi:hypothetical protein
MPKSKMLNKLRKLLDKKQRPPEEMPSPQRRKIDLRLN